MSRSFRRTAAVLVPLLAVLLGVVFWTTWGAEGVGQTKLRDGSTAVVERPPAIAPATVAEPTAKVAPTESRALVAQSAPSPTATQGTRVRGVVRSAAGKPLESALVRTDVGKDVAMTAGDGSFSLALPDGTRTCSLTVSRDFDSLPTTRSNVDVEGTRIEPIMIVLHSRDLHVRVDESGGALDPSVFQQLRAFGDNVVRREVPAAYYRSGSGVLPVKRPSRTSACEHDRCLGVLQRAKAGPVVAHVVWGSEVVGTARTADTESSIDVPVDVTTIRTRVAVLTLRVRNGRTGEPVSNASVDEVFGRNSAKSDERGEARFEALPFGMRTFWIQAPGFADATRHVDVQSTQEEPAPVDLYPPVAVKGVARDASGNPVACRVEIQSLPERRSAGLVNWITDQTTQSDGKFRFSDLERAEYVIRARSQAHGVASVVVDLRSGNDATIEIRLDVGQDVLLDCAPRISEAAWSLTVGDVSAPTSLWIGNVVSGTSANLKLASGRYVCRALDRHGRPFAMKEFDVGTRPTIIVLE